jgi:hypothetical protein
MLVKKGILKNRLRVSHSLFVCYCINTSSKDVIKKGRSCIEGVGGEGGGGVGGKGGGGGRGEK